MTRSSVYLQSILYSKWTIFGVLLGSILLGCNMVTSNPAHVYRAIGQNIRQFACQGKLKSSSVKGVCMFALDCIKNKGTHLGTCIDRFYFGSCCKLPQNATTQGASPLISNEISPVIDINNINPKIPMSSTTYKTDHTNEIVTVRPLLTPVRTANVTTTKVVLKTTTTTRLSKPNIITVRPATTPPTTEPNETENPVAQSTASVYYTSLKVSPTIEVTTEEIPLPTTSSELPETDSPSSSGHQQTPTSTEVSEPSEASYAELTPTTFASTVAESTTSEVPTTEEPSTTTAETFDVTKIGDMDYHKVCGRQFYKAKPTARIVDGEKASFGEWPWQISLRQWKRTTFMHKCGAALLTDIWAITAAHCVEGVPPEDLLLRIGEYDLSSDSESLGHVERGVQITTIHPDFNSRTFENDLALLRFYQPVTFQKNIIPICLPVGNDTFVNRTGTVTGWGRLYVDGPLPNILQEVQVPVITNSECEQEYRKAGFLESIPDIFLCAGYDAGGRDSCEGDSGGPLVIRQNNSRYVLAGVISWGIGCAEPHQPGVYTRISKFTEWINQILVF